MSTALHVMALIGSLSLASVATAPAAAQGPDVTIVAPANSSTRHATNPTIVVDYAPGGGCFVGDPLCWPLQSFLIELNGNDITGDFTFGSNEATNGSGNYGVDNFSNGSNTVHFQACNGYGCSDAYSTVSISVTSTFTVAGVAHPSLQPTSTCQPVPFAPGATLACDGWYYAHGIPGYVTLGTTRSSGLIYSSRVAAGRALAPVDVSMVWDKAASTVQGWWKFGGVTGSHVYWDGRSWDGSTGNVAGRIVVDVPPDSLPTIGRKVVEVGVRVTTVGSGTVDSTAKDTLTLYFLHDSTTTPIARGWGIAGMSRVYAVQGPQITSFDSTWSVMLVASDGAAAYFKRSGTSGSITAYDRPDGVLGALTSSSTGTWFKLLAIDGSASYFSWSSSLGYARLDSTVNNAYVTKIAYRSSSGSPQNIIDPRGDSIYFGYSGTGLGALDSICAPKGAHQQCTTITYTTVGSDTVVDHITDPDAVQTAFKYRTSGFAHAMLDSLTPRARGTYTVVYYDTLPRPSGVVFPSSTDTLKYLAPQLGGFAVINGSSGSPATAALKDSAWGSVTQPVGEVSLFAADRYGKTVVSRDGAGNLRQLNETADGQPASLYVALGEKHVWNYNAVGALTSEGNIPSQITTTYTYDGACASATGYPCRVNLKVFNLEPYIPDTVQAFYNGSTTLVDSVYHSNQGVMHYTREGGGFNRVIRVADFQGHTDSVVYDGTTGNVSRALSDTATPCPGCGARRDTSNIYFDAFGRVDSTVHGAAGVRVTNEYDVIGRVTKVRAVAPGRADSIVTQSIYDDGNRTLTVRDGMSHDIVYRSNLRGLMTSKIDPASNHDSLTYDGDGRVATWTNRRTQTVSYTYDAAGHLHTKTLPGSQTWTYEYDAFGLYRILAPDASVSVREDRDWRGRVTNEYTTANGVSRSVGYRYADTSSVVTLMSDYWGGGYAFDLNPAARTQTVTNPFSEAFTIQYDTLGTINTVGYPSGGSVTLTHDALGQITTAGVSGEVSYARDTLFRLDSLAYNSFVQTFSHDNYSRLASEAMSALGPASESFTYDSAGNRTGTGYRYNGSTNQQRHHAAIGGDTYAVGDSLQFDADGNPTFWRNETSGAYDSLFWDAESRLSRVKRYNSSNVLQVDANYTYDGLGRRNKVTGSGVTQRMYLWNGWQLLAETDLSGNATKRYTYMPGAIDGPLAVREGSTSYWLRQDGQGNVYRVDNTSGTAQSEYAYRAWGDRYNMITENYASRLTYKAREEDPETGLVYMRNRYYSPRLERFVNEDPIGISGGLNTYAFAGNTPHMAGDPMGTDPDRQCRYVFPDGNTILADCGITVWGAPKTWNFGGFGSLFGDRESGSDDRAPSGLREFSESESAIYRTLSGGGSFSQNLAAFRSNPSNNLPLLMFKGFIASGCAADVQTAAESVAGLTGFLGALADGIEGEWDEVVQEFATKAVDNHFSPPAERESMNPFTAAKQAIGKAGASCGLF